MRLGDLLNKLAWSQADLARNAGISSTTVRRVLLGQPISRRNAQAICDALGVALRLPLETTDINEMHISDYQRKERQKIPRPDC
jgi:transcriptional regulator with XRE-family HTH domain